MILKKLIKAYLNNILNLNQILNNVQNQDAVIEDLQKKKYVNLIFYAMFVEISGKKLNKFNAIIKIYFGIN